MRPQSFRQFAAEAGAGPGEVPVPNRPNHPGYAKRNVDYVQFCSFRRKPTTAWR